MNNHEEIRSRCALCAKDIYVSEDFVFFPNFIMNQKDVLALFSCNYMHENCFRYHPLYQQVLGRFHEFEKRSRKPRCVICNKRLVTVSFIGHRDHYIELGHLTDDKRDGLYPFNYNYMHIEELTNWSETATLYRLLSDAVRERRLVSGYYEGLLDLLQVKLGMNDAPSWRNFCEREVGEEGYISETDYTL